MCKDKNCELIIEKLEDLTNKISIIENKINYIMQYYYIPNCYSTRDLIEKMNQSTARTFDTDNIFTGRICDEKFLH